MFFKLLATFSAILVVFARNPVHAVLALVLVFANSANLLILLGADFLALTFLVVYIGAIAVLFLFVVMMLNIKIAETSKSQFLFLPFNLIISILFLIQVTFIVFYTFHTDTTITYNNFFELINYIDNFSNIYSIGQTLFLFYFFPFIIIAFILLISLVGSIILTLQHKSNTRRQLIFKQISRKSTTSLLSYK